MWIYFIVIGIVAKIIIFSSQNNSRGSSQIYQTRNRGRNVPVSYVDRLEEHENPANFTRTSVYCYECGAGLSGSAKFCSTCGTAQNI